MKEQACEMMQTVFVWLTEKGLSFALNVAAALVILILGAVGIRILSSMLRRAMAKANGRHELAIRFVVSVCVKVAWAFLLVTVLGRLGVNVGPIIAGLGVTGFVLGFAFQESLGSLASGLMIAINEPFKVGDYVSVAGYEGTVTALDMMAVTLTTADSRKVTIPNKSAWGSPILNYSATKIRRFDFPVGIAYGEDIPKARRTVLDALAGMPGLLADPAPEAVVTALGDSAVTLTVRLWANNPDYWQVRNEAVQTVKEALDRAGVAIPFPQLDVHLPAK